MQCTVPSYDIHPMESPQTYRSRDQSPITEYTVSEFNRSCENTPTLVRRHVHTQDKQNVIPPTSERLPTRIDFTRVALVTIFIICTSFVSLAFSMGWFGNDITQWSKLLPSIPDHVVKDEDFIVISFQKMNRIKTNELNDGKLYIPMKKVFERSAWFPEVPQIEIQ